MSKNDIQEDDFGVTAEENNEDTSYYNENGFSNYSGSKSLKWIVLAVVFVVLLIIILIIVWPKSKSSNSGGKENVDTENSVSMDVSDILYVGYEEQLKLYASGNGNIDSTQYKITFSESYVSFDNTLLKGKSATTVITPVETGKGVLKVVATIDNKDYSQEKEIFVCNKLSRKTLVMKGIKLKVEDTRELDINLGDDEECYKNITYKSSDEKIASIDEYGVITAVSKGVCIISVTDGESNLQIRVTIR